MFSSLPMPALMLLTMAAIFLTGYVVISLTNAYVNRLKSEKQQPTLPIDVQNQLKELQLTLESVSMEVERISEAQRFTAKLLADQAAAAAKPSAIPHSVLDHDVRARK